VEKVITVQSITEKPTKKGDKSYRQVVATNGEKYNMFQPFPISIGKTFQLFGEMENGYFNTTAVVEVPGVPPVVVAASQQGAGVTVTEIKVLDKPTHADYPKAEDPRQTSIHRQVAAKLAVEAWNAGKIDKEHLKEFATYWVQYFEDGK